MWIDNILFTHSSVNRDVCHRESNFRFELLCTLSNKINCFEESSIGLRASQVAQYLQNPPANAEDVRDVGSIPGSGKFPGGGKGTSFQYRCLVNSVNRGTWQATIPGIAKSQVWLSMHAHTIVLYSYTFLIPIGKISEPLVQNWE